MKRKSEKLFSTGEFAEKFNIKKDTLFYYDRIDLFHPAIVKENGYRYYTSSQIETFWTILSLREIGVSIKTLQEYFNSPSAKQLNIISNNQLKTVEAEIAKLQSIKHLLLRISKATKEIMNTELEQLIIQPLPDEWLIYSEKNTIDIDTSNEQWLKFFDSFVYENGIARAAYVGSVISQKDIENQHYGRVERLFSISSNKTGEKRSGGLFAVFYHKGNYESIPTIYPHILSKIKESGFWITGDAYEEYLAAELTTNNPDEYITKIAIPIKEAKE